MEGHKGQKEGEQINSGSFVQPLVRAARAVSQGDGRWLLRRQSCTLRVVAVALIVTATTLGTSGAGQMALLPTLEVVFPSLP